MAAHQACSSVVSPLDLNPPLQGKFLLPKTIKKGLFRLDHKFKCLIFQENRPQGLLVTFVYVHYNEYFFSRNRINVYFRIHYYVVIARRFVFFLFSVYTAL